MANSVMRPNIFMERSWILVGMMGAGKSAVGRELATSSGREFVDTDQMIQKKLGRTVASIFSAYGEQAFRDHETRILQSLEPGPFVVSTGGGVILRDQNRDELKRLGLTVYLCAEEQTLIDHLSASKKKRPLLSAEDWQTRVREILSSRKALYEQSNVVVSVDGRSIAEVAEAVLQELAKYA